MRPALRTAFIIISTLALFAATMFVAASAMADGSCAVAWGSLPKTAVASPGAPITAVRTGPGVCYDRVVFDVPGTVGAPAGWSVSYQTQVLSEGAGQPLSVPGGAKLAVGLAHPSNLGAVNSSATVAGYRTLRSVVYGGSFEGYSTFGVGVRARLPFRVFALGSPGRIVIDVAHSWS
jgi:hypothetical protein